MKIDIEPVEKYGKKRFRLKVDGKDDRILRDSIVGKTAIRIRLSELITQLG